LAGFALAQFRDNIGIQNEHRASIELWCADVDVQARRLKRDTFSPRDTIHDVEQRRVTMAGDAIVVFDLQQREGRPRSVMKTGPSAAARLAADTSRVKSRLEKVWTGIWLSSVDGCLYVSTKVACRSPR